MPKKRINVTVDETVYEELKARDDINTSGLVNDFLKRYLRGEARDNAAERLRAERLEREAEDKMDEAQSLKKQAQQIRKQFQEEEKKRNEKWAEAVNNITPPTEGFRSVDIESSEWRPNADNQQVKFWADEIGISPKEFCERYPDKRERLVDSDSDTSNHHYQ